MLRLISKIIPCQSSFLRSFHATTISRLREITVEKKDDKTTVIECKYVKSPREPNVIKLKKESDKCPLCTLKLNLKHTDVLILCQYIDSKGNIMRHKDTSLCRAQYILVKELIYMAQHAGLLPEPPPDQPKKPYQLLNTYYDETTINVKPVKVHRSIRLHYLKSKLAPLERIRVDPKKGSYY